jgi:hypothetical protein
MPNRTTHIKRPAICPKRTGNSNATSKGAPATARTPSPARAAPDRKVVHVEANVSEEDTEGGPEQDIKPVVPVVEPARRGNEARCRGREERKQHEIDRRRSTTRPHRQVVVSVALVFGRILR